MEHNHSNHMWMMILACGGAFLLILILPFFGLSKNWSVGIAIIAMVGLHFLMMKGHSNNNSNKGKMKKELKGGSCH